MKARIALSSAGEGAAIRKGRSIRRLRWRPAVRRLPRARQHWSAARAKVAPHGQPPPRGTATAPRAKAARRRQKRSRPPEVSAALRGFGQETGTMRRVRVSGLHAGPRPGDQRAHSTPRNDVRRRGLVGHGAASAARPWSETSIGGCAKEKLQQGWGVCQHTAGRRRIAPRPDREVGFGNITKSSYSLRDISPFA